MIVERQKRQVPYKETIRGGTEIRGRHKKQSGGHGQFGDVVLSIRPQSRGNGFAFDETITGGVVPRQYIGSVEAGVADALKTGPLGFPVVDIAVTLTDGSYHTVDSSDMAFRQAGRLGDERRSAEVHACAARACDGRRYRCCRRMPRPASTPSSRNGAARSWASIPARGWQGWDVVSAHIPEAEIEDLIVELRSATSGVGTFTSQFHHLAELTGRLADQVLASRREAANNETMIASDPTPPDRRAAYPARRESAAQEKSEA